MTDENFTEDIQQFITSLDEIKRVKNELSKKQSYYDTLLSEYYHLIENGKFPAHIKSKIIKGLENCLEERRTIKINLDAVMTLDARLRQKGLNITMMEKNTLAPCFRPTILKEEYKQYSKYLKVRVI